MTIMIGYLRVSTEEQASSGLGMEAQRDTIQRYADAHGWEVVWYVDEGLSAKSLARPQLQAALTRLHVTPKRRDVDGIVVAKLDRLSRSVHDFSGILKRALRASGPSWLSTSAWTPAPPQASSWPTP